MPDRRHGAKSRHGRRKKPVIAFVIVALGLVAVAAVGVDIAVRAIDAKNSLTDAQFRLTEFKSTAKDAQSLQTLALYDAVQKDTSKAAAQLDDPVWNAAEHLPLLGPNLLAFRQTATALNDLMAGVEPVAKAANGLGYNSLKPQNGRIDIAPLKTLTPAMSTVDAAVGRAQTEVDAIDTASVLPQLRGPIVKLKDGLDQAAPVTHELVKVMPVLYPALGGEGTRHYLLIFQNNAEERASGGNPASMAMLDVSDGKISLGKQGNSGDFPHPYHHAPVKWDGSWATIYGPHVSKYVSNITYDPDFPDVAQMARGMWQDVYRGKPYSKVDGVISFDPVALSYLLRATGPIHLPTGETLTSENAVQYLLSDVYAKYTDPAVQDKVFASAAQAVFTAVTNGQGSPQQYVAQLPQMMSEQRLKAWSVRTSEEQLLLTSPAGNMLPEDNSTTTTVGVYTNDDATSKMSYYMDEPITVTSTTCPAKAPTYTASVTVHDTLTQKLMDSLTPYVLAAQSKIVPGGDRERVILYGPVGSTLVSATIDGKKVVWGDSPDFRENTVADATGMDDHRPAVKAELHGRPVASVSVKMGPGGSQTVTAVFSGGTAPSKTVAVSRTPQARPSTVTITQGSCG